MGQKVRKTQFFDFWEYSVFKVQRSLQLLDQQIAVAIRRHSGVYQPLHRDALALGQSGIPFVDVGINQIVKFLTAQIHIPVSILDFIRSDSDIFQSHG